MAGPSLIGSELVLNKDTAANQIDARIMPRSDGGALVYWTVAGADSSVYGRIITSTSRASATDIAFNLPPQNLTADDLPDGAFVFAGRSGNEVSFYSFDAKGLFTGASTSSFYAGDVTITGGPVIATTSDGQLGAVLKTTAASLASFGRDFGGYFDDLELNNGSKISTKGADKNYWNVLDAAGLGNSGLVVATGSGAAIQLHIISAATQSDTSGPIPVTLGSAYVPGSFDLTEMPSGHFIASWRDGTTLKAQQYDQSGHTVGAQMQVDATAPTNFSMTPLADGRILLLWDDKLSGTTDIIGMTFTAAGERDGNPFLISASVLGTVTDPSAAQLADGDILVVWNTAGVLGQDTNGRFLSYTRPDAKDDVLKVSGEATLALTANDTDPNGDSITVSAVGQAAHGGVSLVGGVVTYTPDAGYTGSDNFTYTLTDSNGLTDTATVAITVGGANAAPVFADAAISVTTAEDVAGQFTVTATDEDGDALAYTAGAAAHGSVAGGADGVFTYTPEADFNGSDSFTVTVSDGGGGTAIQTVNVTVEAVNDAPIPSAANQTVSAPAGKATSVLVVASDPDGDPLSFTASAPAHGSVSGGGDGKFVYTPDAGFLGADSFTVTISDDHGGTGQQAVAVTVSEPPSIDWRLLTSDGLEASIGGDGQVFGTGGFEDITVLDMAGTVRFDPSFNGGGDIIRLTGDASDWSVIRSGSSAVFSDGDTSVSIPIGKTGMAIAFDDDARTLRFDEAQGTAVLGLQAFGTAAAVQLGATGDGAELPAGGNAEARGYLLLANGGEAGIAGNLNIFGTSGAEHISIGEGTIRFDPSFNGGGDILEFSGPASQFDAALLGSSVVLSSSGSTVTIPVGKVGAMLDFAGDDRTLYYNSDTAHVMIDNQVITSSNTQLIA